MLLKPLSNIILAFAAVLWISGCSGDAEVTPPTNQHSSYPDPTPSPTVTVATPKPKLVSKPVAVEYPPTSRAMEDGLTSAIVEVTGQVKFINGAPASSATVSLMKHSPGIGRSVTMATTSTDSSGRFHVRGEDQRQLALGVTGDFPSAYVQLLTKTTPYSGLPGIRRFELDVTVPESQSLTGKVVDAAGQELDGVAVHLLPSSKRTPEENTSDHRPRETLQTTTTVSGDFQFEHLSNGDWIAGARVDGFAPVTIPVSIPTSEPAIIRFTDKGGTVNGRVVHLQSREPVSNVSVFLGPGDMNQLPGIESQQTTSSADGTFTFENLSTGPLRVYTESVDRNLYMALPRPGNISLGDGETTQIEVLLYPGHTIYGRVTDRDTKDPVAGVTLTARSAIQSEKVTTTTDEQGNYRLESIVPYSTLETFVEAEHERYSPEQNSPHRQDTSTKRVALSVDGSPVELNFSMIQNITISGKVVTADDVPVGHAQVRYLGFSAMDDPAVPVDSDGKYRVYAPPFTAGGIEATAKGFAMAVNSPVEVTNQPVENVNVIMSPGASVIGTVMDENSNPIEGAVVGLSREFNNMSFGVPSVITAADGTFQFTDLPQNVKLHAQKEGYENGTPVDLELQPGEVRNGLALTLEKQGTGTISGTVVGSNGSPAKGVVITILPAQTKTAVSREDGSFELSGLKEGTYDLRIPAPQQRIIHSVKTGTTDLRIVVDATPAPQGPVETFTLEGTVVDDISGAPVQDFTIEALPTYQVRKQAEPGTFIVTVRARTSFPILIRSPEHEEQMFYTESGKAGETVKQTFRLGKPGVISGRLIDERDEQPMPNVSVLTMGVKQPWGYDEIAKSDTVTDAEGKFTLANVPNGTNRLVFLLPDPYAPLTMEVEVKSDAATDLGDVKAGAGGDIFGTVVRGPQKEPVAGLQVAIRAVTGDVDFNKTLLTNSEGKFDVVGLQDARYEIRAGNVRHSTEIKANIAEVLIHLGSVKISGTVRAGAEPYRGWVMFKSPDLELMAHTELDGSYVLEHVTAGKYRIVISDSSGVIHQEDVTVPDEPEFTKNINIPSGRIRVILTDEAGKPAPGITVNLTGDALSTDGRYSERSEQANPEGICVFTDLKPGNYTVTVDSLTERGQGIQEVQIQGDETKDVKVQTRTLPRR